MPGLLPHRLPGCAGGAQQHAFQLAAAGAGQQLPANPCILADPQHAHLITDGFAVVLEQISLACTECPHLELLSM